MRNREVIGTIIEMFGIVVGSLLAGLGVATLFIHFTAGGCVP
jgi:hypothetical protein